VVKEEILCDSCFFALIEKRIAGVVHLSL